jgi:tetratricopeptide (TPR) repeat protein
MNDESYYQPRKVNVLAIGVVAVATLGLAAGLFFVYRWQVQRNAVNFLAESRQAEEAGDLKKAAGYLMQYLALKPEATAEQDKHFAHYAELSQKLASNPQQQQRALALIEQALRRSSARLEVPQQDSLRRTAAGLAVELGRYRKTFYDAALPYLDELRKRHKEDEELYHLEARALAGTRKNDQAAELYTKISQLWPQNVRAWEERLVLERDVLKNVPGCDDLAARMVEVNPKSVPAYHVAARHFVRRGNVDKALELVTIAQQKLGARSPELVLLGAELASFKGRGKEAREWLAAALKERPDDVQLRLAAVRVELRLGQKEQARELLEPFRKALPENPEQLCEIGLLLIDLGGKDEKEMETIRRRLDRPATEWALALMQGQQFMRNKEWGKARVKLDELRSRRRLPGLVWERQIDLMLADCYRGLGNPDQQTVHARRALESDPTSTGARLRLAQGLAGSGKIEQALSHYKGLLEGEPDARIAQIRVLLVAQSMRKEKDRDWGTVERALDELPQKDKDSLEASVLRAELEFARGRLDQARKLVEAARTRDPNQPGLYLFLAEVARMEGKPARALGILEEAERRLGRRVDWTLARIRLAVSTGGKDGLDQLRVLEEGRQKLAAGPERDLLTARLAQAYAQLGDGKTTERLYLELAQAQPHNLEVNRLLAEQAWRAGDDAKLKDYLTKVEEAEGQGGPFGAVLKAMLCLTKDGDGAAAARKQLEYAGKLRPSWPRVPALLGEIDDREGKREEAAKKYLAAIDLGESRVVVLQRAVLLLFEMGRYTEADVLLRRLPEKLRQSGELGRVTATLSLVGDEQGVSHEQRQKRALEMARQVVRGGTSDFRNYVFLGQMAALAGENKEAEEALLKARELAPGEPSAWVALVQFYARTDLPRAKKELAEAEKKIPTKPTALASCHEVLGQLPEARKFYQAALAAQPRNPQVLANVAAFLVRDGQNDEAVKLWRKMLTADVPASEGERRGARRALAILLALSRSYPAYKEALDLIEVNLKAEESVEDRRIQAVVKATQPAERREAIRLFEKLAPLSLSTPPEVQLLLARLCEAESDPALKAKAVEYVEALVRNAPDNPGYLSYAAMVYLRQSQPDQATATIDRLAKRAGDTFAVAELRARVCKAKGQPEEARRLIEASVRGHDDRLVPGALVLDALGEHAAAEAMLRRLAFELKQADGLVLLAEHYGRRKQLDKALEMCEQAWGKVRPEAVAMASLQALRVNAPSKEQLDRVGRRLEEAQRKAATSVLLLACLAELEEMRGRHEEVVRLYRRVLSLQPGNVVAMNNLAYYLSVKEGKHDEALDLLKKVLEMRGPIGEILDTRGLIYLGAKRPDDALKDFQAAVKQDAGPVKLFHLARGYLAVEDLTAAREYYKKAKAQGLKEEALPPLERQAWKDMAERLGSE